MPPSQSKLVLPGGKPIVSAADNLAEQQQRLYEAAQIMRGAHIHALAEAYFEETGLKAEETALVEQCSPDGLARRYFFVRKTSPGQPADPPPGNIPTPTASEVPSS